MKLYPILIALIILSCQHSSKQEKKDQTVPKKEIIQAKPTEEKAANSNYQRESDHFISLLEEMPNRDTNVYKITITSKDGKIKFSKMLDTRPQMSRINYCNDTYTVVGFPCGGPCYSRVFIFTDKNRPVEQYLYPQEVKNNINLIGHIENEEFENLIIHNFLNSEELVVHLPDSNPWNYGQVDSMLVEKESLILYYPTKNKKNAMKKVNLKAIL